MRFGVHNKYCLVSLALAIVFLAPLKEPPALASGSYINIRDRKYSVFAYVGEYHHRHIHQILTGDTKSGNTYVWSLAATRHIYDISEDLSLELEVNTAYHTRKQHHWEINSSLNLRWHSFPWDEYVNTSFAYGLGPSYAFKKPFVEEREDTHPSHLLVFMPVELTFTAPDKYDATWESFVRIHHRSGAWGVVSNSKGSNFISAGIRYRF